MAAPTLVASYFVKSSTTGTAALTTPSFTPSNGEVIVITLETWDTGTSMGLPTGGSQTYTSRVAFAPGGFKPWVGIYTAVISGSPGSMTISSSPSASARYSMTVERWSGATLAATPVTATDTNTTTPQATLTTSAANSIISWVSGDSNSRDPATRAYLLSGTDDGTRDDHVGSNGVGYHAYVVAASAGSQTFGLSAPSSQAYAIAGIEILAASAPSGATPDGIAATVALGTPTTSLNLSAAPTGQAHTLALGVPTVSIPAAAPTGIAIASAAGTPSASYNLATAPSGIALSVSLGVPTPGSQSGGVAPAGIALTAALGTPATAYNLTTSPAGIARTVALGPPSTLPPVNFSSAHPRLTSSTTAKRVGTDKPAARITTATRAERITD
jgi:hypothetical protein